jgi:diguanylate cyclase (GGDEF)-like protein
VPEKGFVVAKFRIRKITNIAKARKIASRYPKSIVKVSYGMIITVFVVLVGWGVTQSYQKELVQQQQEINAKTLGVDALLKTTLNNADLLRSQAEYFLNQSQPSTSPVDAARLNYWFTTVKKQGQVLSYHSFQDSDRTSVINIEQVINDIVLRKKLLKLLKNGNQGQISTCGHVITYQRLNNATWVIVKITPVKTLFKDILIKQLPIILGVLVGMTGLLLISLKIIDRAFERVNKARILAELANIKLQRALTELELLASTDKLTGAWNRRYFEQIASAEMNRVARHNQPLSLLILDIDYFKSINDKYGHQIGDAVIAGVAHLIKNNIRTSDILTRWGGEEFVILAPSTSISEAAELADRLRLVVTKHSFSKVENVTVSFGVAQFQAGENLDDCLKRADDALYQAKNSGRNTVIVVPSLSFQMA